MAKYRAELRQTHVGSAYDQYLLDTDSRCVANNFDNTSTDFSATDRPALKPGESLDQSMIKIDKLLKNLKTFSFNAPATVLNLDDNSTDTVYGKKVINDEVNNNTIVNGLFQTGFANLGVAIDPTSKTYTGLTADIWSIPYVGVNTSTGGGSTVGQKRLYYGTPWLKLGEESGRDKISFGVAANTSSSIVLPMSVKKFNGSCTYGKKIAGVYKLLGILVGEFDGIVTITIPYESFFANCESVYVGMSEYPVDITGAFHDTDYLTTHRKLTKGVDYAEDTGLVTMFPVYNDKSWRKYVSIIVDAGTSGLYIPDFDYQIRKIITD